MFNLFNSICCLCSTYTYVLFSGRYVESNNNVTEMSLKCENILENIFNQYNSKR